MSEQLPPNEQPASASRPMNVSGGSWWGIALIVVGGIFLLQQFTGLAFPGNWWAVFILVPACIMLYNAYQSYQSAGNVLNRQSRSQLIGGLILLMVAVIFLANLSWGTMWPVFLIIAGIAAILNTGRSS